MSNIYEQGQIFILYIISYLTFFKVKEKKKLNENLNFNLGDEWGLGEFLKASPFLGEPV